DLACAEAIADEALDQSSRGPDAGHPATAGRDRPDGRVADVALLFGARGGGYDVRARALELDYHAHDTAGLADVHLNPVPPGPFGETGGQRLDGGYERVVSLEGVRCRPVQVGVGGGGPAHAPVHVPSVLMKNWEAVVSVGRRNERAFSDADDRYTRSRSSVAMTFEKSRRQFTSPMRI